MRKRLTTSLLACALVTSAATSLRADVLVSESFDYEVGPLAGASGGEGWSGGWVVGTNPAPTYSVIAQDIATPSGYGAPLGKQAFIDPGAANDNAGGATPDIRRTLADPFDLDAEQTLYFGMLVRREDVTNGGSQENNSYFRLNDASGSHQLGVGHESDESFRIALGSATNRSISDSIEWEIGVDYLLVGRLTTNPSGSADVLEASLLTPEDSFSEPTTWGLQVTADLSGTLPQLQLGTARRAGRAFIDEIRIGTAFADIAVAAAAVPGDADGDGDVDAFDLGIWQTQFGQTAEGLSADFDSDGDVDAFDLGIWQINFGTGGEAAIPEPATLITLIAAGMGLTLRRR